MEENGRKYAQAGTAFQVARHVSVDRSFDLAVARLTSGDGIVAKGVFFTHGALVFGCSGDVGRADAVAGDLVARGSRGTLALFAIGISEKVRLATRALASDDVGLAVALASDGRAFRAFRAFGVAVAVQGAVVEVTRKGNECCLAKTLFIVVDVEVVFTAFASKLQSAINLLRVQELLAVAVHGNDGDALQLHIGITWRLKKKEPYKIRIQHYCIKKDLTDDSMVNFSMRLKSGLPSEACLMGARHPDPERHVGSGNTAS